MKWKSLFKTVNSLNPDEAKAFIAARSVADYQLLDVRQPKEYDKEHLPGARLIPLKQLPERHAGLDRQKPLLVYCAVGGGAGLPPSFWLGRVLQRSTISAAASRSGREARPAVPN